MGWLVGMLRTTFSICGVNMASECGDLWQRREDEPSDSRAAENIELRAVAPRNGTSKTARGSRLLVRPSVSSMHCVSFHDLRYEITQRKCFRRLPDKIVLNSLSGLLMPGLNAIMGPTGSGKTSLLDILAARKSSGGISGTVLVDGSSRPSNFKCMVGYVVQDDVVMGTLSVRENLHFSAALRLNLSFKERKERVEEVIDELGLNACSNTKVGTEFIRGISGGERKRTNIGLELITEPQILFLDEPTTGLDAYTAVSVVQLLKDLTVSNSRIVIMSIHQPRYAIFKLFDSLTLLSLGNMVYHGSAKKALEYFCKLGFDCEEHDNPADFFLDVINRCELKKKSQQLQLSNPSQIAIEKQVDGAASVDLGEKFSQSVEHREMHNVIDSIIGARRNSIEVEHKLLSCVSRFPTSYLWQWLMVTARSAINLIKNPATSILELLTQIMFAVIIGGIYFQLGTGALDFQNRIGVFFFIVMSQAFGSMSAIDVFIRQRPLFIHENASGYYSVSVYFIAKVTVDMFALRLIPNTALALVTYFMVGFQLSAERFFIFWLVVMLTDMAALSVVFFLSAGMRDAAIASLLIGVAFAVSALFGGLFIALDSLPVWVNWIKYLSFIRYGVEGMANNELDGLVFDCFPANINAFNQSVSSNVSAEMFSSVNCTVDGLEQLRVLGYEPGWLWYDVLALILFTIIFLFIAYLVLRLIKKEK